MIEVKVVDPDELSETMSVNILLEDVNEPPEGILQSHTSSVRVQNLVSLSLHPAPPQLRSA